MTRDAFAQLAAQGVILLDGATGSNLMTAGKPRGVCTEQWVLDHPLVLQDLQRERTVGDGRICVRIAVVFRLIARFGGSACGEQPQQQYSQRDTKDLFDLSSYHTLM